MTLCLLSDQGSCDLDRHLTTSTTTTTTTTTTTAAAAGAAEGGEDYLCYLVRCVDK